MIVYLVSSGEYSDYTIEGVFETLQKATQWIDKQKHIQYDTRIEVWEDDEEVNGFQITLEGKIEQTEYWKKQNEQS